MKYVAVVGINYAPPDAEERRFEPGEPVPPAVLKASPWLVEQGLAVPASQASIGAGEESAPPSEPGGADAPEAPAVEIAAEAHLSGALTVTRANGEVA